MRLTMGSIIPAGITASIVVMLFLLLVPQFLGLQSEDISREIGLIFSIQAPHFAGAVFIALMGIIGAMVFAALYPLMPGTPLTKGCLFGLVVGITAKFLMPPLLTALSVSMGHPERYCPITSSSGGTIQVIITLAAYLIFGLVVSWSYRPYNHNH